MKIGFIVILIILALPIANAKQSSENPGITPDSFMWGLDNAMDRLSLLLTFDEGDKAKKGIEIARERLLEVKAMVEENKLQAAAKAKDEHGRLLINVKESIRLLEKDNSTEEIEDELEIEKELEEHEDDVDKLDAELKVKIKIEGAITEEQKALINSILHSLKGQTGEVEIEIKNKKDKTKIKIKQETSKTEKEIEDEVEELEEEIGLEDKELEIEVEIEDGIAKVEIENGDEQKFTLKTTDKEAILSEIASRLNTSVEQIRNTVEFEIEEENEADDEIEVKDKIKVKIEEKEED
ncbi:hypothetical protein HY487_00885 [Candidatus Woesearchaeota archaeon]|nr:hypothetical protein [Candidatus Woesearchaeota archaeon]